MRNLLMIMAAALVGGCATIVEGTSQPVRVATPGAEGAGCSLSSPDASYHVVTPGTVTVQKTKHDIDIVCKKEGYRDGLATLASRFEGWTLGNLLLGGPIGVGVDAATGAWNDFQDSISIPMERILAFTPPVGGRVPVSAPVIQPLELASFGVQFGAYESSGLVQQGWADIWSKHWQLLGGVQPEMRTSEATAGETRYYLYGSGLTKERAESLCWTIQQRGDPCSVVRF